MTRLFTSLFLFVSLTAVSASDPVQLAPPTVSDPVKNFPLVNQQGKPFQLHDLKGQHVLLSFIFTRCPMAKMCPLTVSLNKQVLRAYKRSRNPKKLHFLFVTLDPEYDTATALTQFAKARSLDRAHFTLATGNPQVLSELASEFNVIGFPSGGSTLISHNLKTILLDPDMRELKQFKDNEWKPEDVMRALFSDPVSLLILFRHSLS